MYKVWDSQNQEYMFGGSRFHELKDAREQIVSYLETEVGEEDLKGKSLAELCELYEFEIRNTKGEILDFNS